MFSRVFHSEMALSNIAGVATFQENILGNLTHVTITIDNTFKASIDFTLLGRPYSFTITSWASRGQQRFLETFHTINAPKDPHLYGVMVVSPDGSKAFYDDNTDINVQADGSLLVGPSAIALTKVKKVNSIERACRDIIICLNMIGQVHQRSVLEYCIWYREQPHTWNYSETITHATASCVVHSDFMSPNIQWTLVEFPPP
jgi:hypothetical protein